MQHLILLHGAIGSSAQLQPLAQLLDDSYIVHRIDFPGHGGATMPDSFSMELFRDHVLEYLDEHNIETASFFGYSMGGYVALLLAASHPQRVSKMITLATKFTWSEEIAAKEVKMLQPETIEEKIPAFATTLKERHAPNDWKKVLQLTASMLMQLGRNPLINETLLSSIRHPILLLLGENDKMVTVHETQTVADHLSNSKMQLLPSTPHPIEHVDISLLANHISTF